LGCKGAPSFLHGSGGHTFKRFSLTTGFFVIGFKFSTGINDDGSSKLPTVATAEYHAHNSMNA
jgi:hypothetical protein